MGTVNYMAPEQHTDAKRVDYRTDLYACGVIFYECITGDLPIGRYALPVEGGIDLPDSVDKCILKALARSPDNRFQSAGEFDTALAQIEKDLEMSDKKEASIKPGANLGGVFSRQFAAKKNPQELSEDNAWYQGELVLFLSRVVRSPLLWALLTLTLGLILGVLLEAETLS